MTGHVDRLAAALTGRYAIVRELGQGGMATVYLGHDERHDRDVAIKVLHPELSAVLGPDRFLAEIKLTAALQHPHILPLFDSGSADGLLFYVMPFVEGETLRTRITRERQLPVGHAVRIACEVADALGYAHGRGVVHRDIKPENILLREGHALVADFGIALAVKQAGGERMTQTGMSLGTPQYMAPEQAMGERSVDHRSDLYALAAVTYEMLAGEPPFTGPTAQAIVAKVMTEEPKPLGQVRRTVPAAVESAVATGLEKLPADRFDSAAEFARALTAPDGGVRRHVTLTAPRARMWLAAGLLLGAVALAGAYGAGRVGRGNMRNASVPPSRLAILSPDVGGTGVASQFRQLALTPAGDAVVFVTVNPERQNHLAYQRLDQPSPRLIEGGMGMLSPQVSPDGGAVIGYGAGLFSGEQEAALRVPLGGGNPVSLGNVVQSRHAYWTADGTYWFSPANGGIARLAPDGSIVPAAGGRGDGLQLQQVLEDGRTAIAVVSPLGTASGPVVLVDLETGEQEPLIDAATVEARVAAGHLLHVRADGTIWAAPFDARTRRASAPPVQIADGVSLTGTQIAQWSVAPTGTVAYIPEEPRTLVFVSREGAMRPAVDFQRNFHSPRFSPDGREIAVDFTSADGRDVWILSLAQRTLNRATFRRDGHDATWDPDGRTLLFTSFHTAGTLGIHRTLPGGGTAAESLFASAKLGYTGLWTPSGDTLISVATDLEPRSGIDLALIDGGGRGSLQPLLVDQFDTQYPALSPDGRWLAFVSNQSGGQQVYVRPLVGPGRQVQVSQEGGTEPMWSPDGKELFYIATARAGPEFVSASVRAGAEFEVVGRQALFGAAEIVGSNPHANYDVAPDGRSFIMVRRSPANRIVVLQNLPELVRRLRTESAGPR